MGRDLVCLRCQLRDEPPNPGVLGRHVPRGGSGPGSLAKGRPMKTNARVANHLPSHPPNNPPAHPPHPATHPPDHPCPVERKPLLRLTPFSHPVEQKTHRKQQTKKKTTYPPLSLEIIQLKLLLYRHR